jgi:hypothetical protein
MSNVQKDEVSDTTGDDQGTEAGHIIILMAIKQLCM